MERTKFKSEEDQRQFFKKVKRKLGIGSKKLSERLGLKSRGPIESYSLARTSPPSDIIKKLEKISGIKGEYEIIYGKVCRKKREFLPENPEIAVKELKKKFGKDMTLVEVLIKSDLSIKEIIRRIRESGDKSYTFDNSKISRWIGAYRTGLKIRIMKKVISQEDEIIVSGFIRKDRKTNSISFNLINLYQILLKCSFRVGLEISENRESIRIFPLAFGRTLIPSNGAIKILITEKSGLQPGKKVKIILNPKEFGFSIYDSIYDADAKFLIKELVKEGFILDNYRSTPSNHMGDLSVHFNGINYLIEITRAKSYKSCYFKIGQCYVQKITWPNSRQVLICKEGLLLPSARKALKKMRVRIIETDFEGKWEKKIAQKLKENL